MKRSTKERIYVDKIDPREHLHITGVEFTDSMIRDISGRNGSNSFKEEQKVAEAKPTASVEQPKAKPV